MIGTARVEMARVGTARVGTGDSPARAEYSSASSAVEALTPARVKSTLVDSDVHKRRHFFHSLTCLFSNTTRENKRLTPTKSALFPQRSFRKASQKSALTAVSPPAFRSQSVPPAARNPGISRGPAPSLRTPTGLLRAPPARASKFSAPSRHEDKNRSPAPRPWLQWRARGACSRRRASVYWPPSCPWRRSLLCCPKS